MSGMDPQLSAFLIFCGMAVLFIVAQILMAGAILAVLATVFGTIFAILAAIFGSIISVIYFMVKWTKPVWYPILTAILWVWLASIKVAAVVAIICLGLWAFGRGDMVSAGYAKAQTFVMTQITK